MFLLNKIKITLVIHLFSIKNLKDKEILEQILFFQKHFSYNFQVV